MQDLETFETDACEGLEMLFSAGDSADTVVSLTFQLETE